MSEGYTTSYSPPLNGPLYATSSFGEYREGRFHMGVDFRASKGTPVLAIDDGYIARLKCGPWGGGKCIYLRCSSGMMAVYMHLDSFAEPMLSYVRRVQHDKKSYTVDISLSEHELNVSKGSVIGYAGYSGTTAPHLHFELRKSDGVTCVNPWEYGFRWIDEHPPRIKSVLLIPASPDTVINGRCQPYKITFADTVQDKWVTISAQGEVYLAVSTEDIESGSCKLGPYRIQLKESEQTLSVIEQKFLDYQTNRDAKVSFYPYDKSDTFWTLWRWVENRSSNYMNALPRGIRVTDETHLNIQVEDFHNRVAYVPLYIQIDDEHSVQGEINSSISIRYLPSFLVISIPVTSTSTGQSTPLVECVDEVNKIIDVVNILKRTENLYEAVWTPPRSGKFRLSVSREGVMQWQKELYVVRSDSHSVTVEESEVHLTISPRSAYGVLWLSMEPIAQRKLPEGMRLMSTVWRLEPMDCPIREPVSIAMQVDADENSIRRIHLYTSKGKDWRWIASESSGNRITASLSQWGNVALCRDDAPPTIGKVSIAENAILTTRRPDLSCVISDIGSGIARAEIYCNGKWLLSEYDGPRGTLRWERDEDLPRGRCKIDFVVTDQAGLTTIETRTITVQ